MKHKILFIFCSLFALVLLLSTLAIPVGAQQQAATATPFPSPTPEAVGGSAELVTENPYGSMLSLVLSDVFPEDVASYYGDGSPTPSGAVTSNDPVEYAIAAGEYITCAGGGFNATDEFTRSESPLASVFPTVLGTGVVTFINRGDPVTFTMSANAGTWCTRGLVMGSTSEAATRLAGMYTYGLLTQALPTAIQVEVHIIVNTADSEYRWAGTVSAENTIVSELTGQGGGAVGVTDWSTVVLDADGGPTTWPLRLDTTQFNTVQTAENCWVENDPNVSCTTEERQPTSGPFVLRSGIGLRMSGDGISIFDASGEHLLISRPSEDHTDWWFILNDSEEDLNLWMVAPNGSDRQYFQLGNDAVWDTETVDLMFRNGMRQFLAPEETVTSVATPTPEPNCGSLTEGCRTTNVRALVYVGEGVWIVLYYGVASEVVPFWTPVLPVPSVNWPVNG
jgi:hypothetical protein